jgi:NAD(P)H-nitrite reductase large subunit
MAMVCLCNNVNERKIVKAIKHGATTVDAVGDACDAGTCCMGCHPVIENLIAERVATAPDPTTSAQTEYVTPVVPTLATP